MKAFLFLLPLVSAAQLQKTSVLRCDHSHAVNFKGFSQEHPMPFCANGGQCRSDWILHPEAPCICDGRGYGGPHCEIPADDMQECTLPCKNDGYCMMGATSSEQLDDPGFNLFHQYCLCPPYRHGLLCEKSSEPCGPDLVCHNGGTCVAIESDLNSPPSFHCDCSTSGNDEIVYAGESCEYPSTTFCGNGIDHNGRHFCTNGGTCQTDSHLGCDCPDGFVGPVCEFRDQQVDVSDCSLRCENHGVCRKGAKDLSAVKLAGMDHIVWQNTYSEDFEHCVCPAGYAGLQCEYEINVCAGGQKVCLNGGSCFPRLIKDDTEIVFDCDCRQARKGDSRFAGDFCEMQSTEFCANDGLPPSRGASQDAFCTNEGTCRETISYGQPHPGCECPRGFTGFHCEYRGVDVRVPDVPGEGEHKRSLYFISILMLAIGFAAMCTLLPARRRRRRDILDQSQAPTIDSNDPWNTLNLHDICASGEHEEHYEDVDLGNGNLNYSTSCDDHSIHSSGSVETSTAFSVNRVNSGIMNFNKSFSTDEFHVFHDNDSVCRRTLV